MLLRQNAPSVGSHQAHANPSRRQIHLVASYANSGHSCTTQIALDEQDRTLLDHFQVQINKTRPPSSLTKSLMETLIDDNKANKRLAQLLAFTLVASILNTLLLSFAIGFLRLSDKDPVKGKISWDEHIRGSVFEPTTKLPSKSILLNFIESYREDKPLVLQHLSRKGSFGHSGVDEHDDGRDRPDTSVFLLSSKSDSPGSTSSSMATRQSDNCNDGAQKSLLEISTGLFAMDLINDQLDGQQQSNAFNKKVSLDPNNAALSSGNHASEKQQAGDERPTSSPLLVLEGNRATVTLPRGESLCLSPNSASSLIVEEQLGCQEISGSLGENLDIQAHDGDLRFKSGDHMRLVSKTAALKMTALEDMVLKAPSVSLSGSRLYLTGGIQYLDTVDSQTSRGSVDDERQFNSSERLQAYNLVAIDGMLMAA